MADGAASDASMGHERAARIVALASSLFVLVVASLELFGPLPGGHLGNAAGAAIAGENMLTHRLFGASLEYTNARPPPASLYTHHPYGVFVLSAISHALFGHHWATVRLPAVLLSAATPYLTFSLARRLFGPVAGAVAAVVFALVPIDLAFASFHNLEVPTIFFGLLFSLGTARFFERWRARDLALSTAGALGACHADWVGLVLVGVVGIMAFVRAYVAPRAYAGRIDDRAHARWFAFSTAAAVSTLLLYLVLFARAGKLADLLGSYDARSSGSSARLVEVFSERRRMWVLWMLPWPALVGVFALVPLSIERALRDARAYVLVGWLAAASFQYFVFKQGADVHIFWPHYYGLVAALGWAAVTHAAARLSPRVALQIAPAAVAALLLGRVALPLTEQSRLTGGRFDDGGRYIAVDQDRTAFAAWAAEGLPPTATVALHRSMLRTWNIEYALRRPVVTVGIVPQAAASGDDARTLLVDARGCSGGELRQLAQRFALTFAGPYVKLDRAAPHAPLTALAYHERQPRPLERVAVTFTDLVRSIGPEIDPWATYEWRSLLDQQPDAPALEPATADALRVAHNAAVDAGDLARAAALRPRVEASLPKRLDVRFSDGLRLVSMGVDEGAATVVSLLFETLPDYRPIDVDFLVRSRVVQAPRLWPSAVDFFEKEVAPPIAQRPSLWKPSRFYLQRFVAMRRLGRERFYGSFAARGVAPPRPLSGEATVPLFERW